jgi:hypothetical protein
VDFRDQTFITKLHILYIILQYYKNHSKGVFHNFEAWFILWYTLFRTVVKRRCRTVTKGKVFCIR